MIPVDHPSRAELKEAISQYFLLVNKTRIILATPLILPKDIDWLSDGIVSALTNVLGYDV